MTKISRLNVAFRRGEISVREYDRLFDPLYFRLWEKRFRRLANTRRK